MSSVPVLANIKDFKELIRFYFDFEIGDVNEDEFDKFCLESEVWDIRQCDICGRTIVLPYNSVLRYHISKKHLVPGNYKSILENNKPVTLIEAFEKFKLDGMEKTDDKDFLILKSLLIKKEILDLKAEKE